MIGNVDSILRVPANTLKDFLYYWFKFLKPIHKLTNREIDVIVSIVKCRMELAKVITDDSIIDSILLREENRKQIMEDCGIKLQHFQFVLGKLRKNKVLIDDNRVNPKFIPPLKDGALNFKMLILFDFKNKLDA